MPTWSPGLCYRSYGKDAVSSPGQRRGDSTQGFLGTRGSVAFFEKRSVFSFFFFFFDVDVPGIKYIIVNRIPLTPALETFIM